MGNAVIDSVRAARRLPGAVRDPAAPVVFRGYSQGGGAALWAARLQPAYAPELRLAGVAAGGVPADLVQVGLPLDGGEGFGFFLYTLVGLDAAYPDVDLAAHLNDAGRAAVAHMRDEVCTLGLILDLRGRSVAELTTSSPFTPAMLARVAENRLEAAPLSVPVLQYHAVGDGLVAFDQAKALRDGLCTAGVAVDWRPVDSGGESGLVRHIDVVYQGNELVNRFVEARLAGAPATSNCGSG
jgi:hypothetical protein